MDDHNRDKDSRVALIAALITAVIGLGIIVLVVSTAPKNKGQGYGVAMELAGIMFGEFLLMAIAAVVFSINQKTKPIGRGVLLGMLITMVIGFGICTSV